MSIRSGAGSPKQEGEVLVTHSSATTPERTNDGQHPGIRHVPIIATGARRGQAVFLTDRPVKPVPRVAQARNNKPLLIEFFIESAEHDGQVPPGGGFFDCRKPLGCPQDADSRNVGRTLVKDEVNRLQQ
jgi:hypothetical protein